MAADGRAMAVVAVAGGVRSAPSGRTVSLGGGARQTTGVG